MSGRRLLEDRTAKAAARAAVSGRPSVVTLAAPAGKVDPLALALKAGPPFVYWESPDRGFSAAALGEAYTIAPEAGPNRFADASAALRDLAARTHQAAFDGAERTPLLLGGFSFHPHRTRPGFPPGRLTLPDLALIHRGGGNAVWVAAALIGGEDDPGGQAGRLIERIERAAALRPVQVEPLPEGRPPASAYPGGAGFLEKAEKALKKIRGGGLEKVVLARRVEVKGRPELGPLLAALRRTHRACAVFAFAFGGTEGPVFCGATPELLARVDGVKVSALALAGTAPRGSGPAEDRRLAERLMNDPKELAEHRLVHDEIRRRLEDGGFALDPPAPTGVLRLAGIQHLAAPVNAVAPVGTNILDAAGALHPTPAVAGLPGGAALDWIDQNEGFDRGWYAGPVGYCGLDGNGEFHAALRCCLIEGGRSLAFAGAGIVAASSPERELEETGLKLGAVLPHLYGAGAG